jgi:DNA-directed RNA polymerase specialized sigma24 family protein
MMVKIGVGPRLSACRHINMTALKLSLSTSCRFASAFSLLSHDRWVTLTWLKILQDGLLRAVRAAPERGDEDRLVSWFYSVLRNAVIDSYRRRGVERRHVKPPGGIEPGLESDDEDERALCACFEALIQTFKPEYAEIIKRTSASCR